MTLLVAILARGAISEMIIGFVKGITSAQCMSPTMGESFSDLDGGNPPGGLYNKKPDESPD